MTGTLVSNWFHYFYIPSHGAWYTGNVWGNLFVIAIVAPLGWLWSKTKFWPLRPIGHAIEHLHRKLDEHGAHLAVIRAHAEHQTKLAQDHYERAFGERHPDHGKLDHLNQQGEPL